MNKFKVKGKVWLYSGEAAWHFISLPKTRTIKINKLFADQKRGWGSLPVKATIGATTWQTSIFPESKNGTYLLPLKAAVRKKEKITASQTVAFTIEILI